VHGIDAPAFPTKQLRCQLKLFTITKCKTVLTSKYYPLSPELVSEASLRRIEVPEVSEMLVEGKVREYKFSKTFDEAKNDPFLILHSE
jgi:hypothetical protein